MFALPACSRLRAAVCWNIEYMQEDKVDNCSRLHAAVCWNSDYAIIRLIQITQPPPRGCVLKLIIPDITTLSTKRSRLRAAVCWNRATFNTYNFDSLAAAFARLCVEIRLSFRRINGLGHFRAFCEPCFRATSCTLWRILHFLSLALSVTFKRFKIASCEFKVSVELDLKCEY